MTLAEVDVLGIVHEAFSGLPEPGPPTPLPGLPQAAGPEDAPGPRFSTLAGFLEEHLPPAVPLLGDETGIFLGVGTLLVVFGDEGAGKSTFAVDAVAHLAAGVPWLGIPVPRPVRCLVIENEGPAALWQKKLAAKAATWDGPEWAENVHVYAEPWGGFSFALPSHRDALNAYCDDHGVDLVVANPTLGLGASGTGTPDETKAFMDCLVDCGLRSTRAFWLLHHKNKQGQMSGDWPRHPDTNVELQRDGNRPRTRVDWTKTRWASLPTDQMAKVALLEWEQETGGYQKVDIEHVGATDDELKDRLDAFLELNPRASTSDIERNVKGTGKRLRALLNAGGYRKEPGPRNATLWSLGGPDQDIQELFGE